MPQGATTAVLTTATANLALAIVALVTGVLAARLLGPERRGHLAAAQVVGTLVGTLGTVCLGQSLVFFVGTRTRSPMVVLKTAAVFAAIWTVLLTALSVLLMPYLLAGQPAAVDGARAYCFFGLTLVFLGFPIVLLRALQHYILWNILRLIAPSCWVAALVLFTVTETRDTVALITTFLFLQMLFVPLVWVLAARRGGTRGHIDISLIRPMLGYGLPLLIAILPREMNFRFDQLMIANVASSQDLGRYAVSVSWAGLSLPLIGAIGYILMPRLTAMNQRDARAALARSSRAGVAISLILGVISALTGPIFVPYLFGQAFSVPIALPLVLAAATSLLGLNGIIEEGLQGMGEPRSVLMGELAGLAVTIPLVIALVPRLGITGAAVASLAGYSVVCLTLSWRVNIRLGIGWSELLVPRHTEFWQLFERLRAVMLRRHPRSGG